MFYSHSQMGCDLKGKKRSTSCHNEQNIFLDFHLRLGKLTH